MSAEGFDVHGLPVGVRSSAYGPSMARVHDWLLGGAHNWAVDRIFGRRVIDRVPELPAHCRENRKFLNRALRHALDTGVRQFVDIGSGLPTVGNVHEIADRYRVRLDSRVVYVDRDPVVRSFGALVLGRSGDPRRHQVLCADLVAGVEQLWQDVLGTGLIDPAEPVGLVSAWMLHWVADSAGPQSAMAFLRDRLVSGSILVLSHCTSSDVDPAELGTTRRLAGSVGPLDGVRLRSRAQIAAFFGDFSLVDPGLVHAPSWRPDGFEEFRDDPVRSRILAGVSRKP